MKRRNKKNTEQWCCQLHSRSATTTEQCCPHASCLPHRTSKPIEGCSPRIKSWPRFNAYVQPLPIFRVWIVIVVDHVAHHLLSTSVDEPVMAVEWHSSVRKGFRPPS